MALVHQMLKRLVVDSELIPFTLLDDLYAVVADGKGKLEGAVGICFFLKNYLSILLNLFLA